MQKSTNNVELLHTQTNANEPLKENSNLITHEEIEETPFIITGSKEDGYFARMGNYRLTEYYKTPEEVIDEIAPFNWKNIVNVICAVIDVNKKIENQKENAS
jgi:hypothetical protein